MTPARITTLADLGLFKEVAMGKISIILLGLKVMIRRYILPCQKTLKRIFLCGVRWWSLGDSSRQESLDSKLEPREETVRNRVLNQQNWLFGSTHLYLQPWQPNFDPVSLAAYKEPIWIKLYNLPMEYWGEASLECIGRSLGMLLEVDEEVIENDSYLYARIKIVAIKKVPTAIFLKSGVSKPAKKWVQIIGEWKVVMPTSFPEKVIPQNSEEPRASKSDRNSGEYLVVGKNVENEGEINPLLSENLIHKKGCSNTKIEYDRESDDNSFQEDVLDNLD
ncbi:hypothetical protein SUGI_0620090 [Cryptomeria japonica]|nr:hypothetical protein SUGI_0620090 [Cryptomeria japonica]